jgi:chemotaxis protein methyltransferase CheR
MFGALKVRPHERRRNSTVWQARRHPRQGEYPLTRKDLSEIAENDLFRCRYCAERNQGLAGVFAAVQSVCARSGFAASGSIANWSALPRVLTSGAKCSASSPPISPGFSVKTIISSICVTKCCLDLVTRAKSGGRVRIWSAGCSDGQEPYSIALTVLGMAQRSDRWTSKILATDIDPKIIAQAKAGIYDEQSIETVDPGHAQAMVHPDVDERRWQVGDQVKQLITSRTQPDGAMAVPRPIRCHLLPQRGHLFR